MEPESKKRRSKLVIFLFVLSLISLLGFLSSGVSYGAPVLFAISTIISLLIIYWTYYARKRAREKDLGGRKLADFALYSFSAVLAIEIIGALILMGYISGVKSFAAEKTAGLFDENLAGLRAESTDDLKKVLTDGVVQSVMKEFADVGAVKSCTQEKWDSSDIAYGPVFNYSSFEMALTGSYTIRCYGEKKPFDVEIMLKRQGGEWKVDNYTYNVELEKDFNLQENRDNLDE